MRLSLLVRPIMKSSVQQMNDANDPVVLLTSVRVLCHMIRPELESHRATEFDILSLVDNTHPAAPELLDDAVVRDGLIDQRTALFATICCAA
jgi:hypothetical protein